MTGTFKRKEAAVDISRDSAQVGKVGQRPTNIHVVRIVDHGFCPERSVFLEVLLYARMLVLDRELGDDSMLHDPSSEGARSRTADLTVKEKLDSIRPAEVQVLPQDLFEQLAAHSRTVKNLGEAEFELPYGKLIAVAGRAVSGGEGVR
jgi:hypothetical protein